MKEEKVGISRRRNYEYDLIYINNRKKMVGDSVFLWLRERE